MRFSFFKPLCFIAGFIFSFNVFGAPLAGTYSIGPAGNYATFTAAVADLNSSGINAPVVFNVASGVYTEQISLNAIAGASALNTIIFQSSSGVNTSVTVQAASSSTFSDPDYVVQLNGSDYIIFKNMTFKRTGTSLYARVVEVSGDASFNAFEGIRFIGIAGASNNSGALVVSEDANAGNTGNTFIGCIFQDGHAGIWWESTSGNSKTALTVSDNSFSNYRYALYLRYVNNAVITGNTMTNAASFNSAQTKGIDCFRCEQNLTIARNKIIMISGTSNYGIDLQASLALAAMAGNISNNMILVGGTGTSVGINSGSLTTYKNYYFNSVMTTGTNATSSSCYYQNGSTNIHVKDNIFVATAGNAMEILAPTTGLLSSDYNVLYTTGVAVGNWGGANAADLATWQALTPSGFDVNSISADPQFVSSTDLHLSSGSPAIGKGIPISGFMEDIDGETRDTSHPDIGADEYSPAVDTCAGFAIDSVVAAGLNCFGDSNGSITVYHSGGAAPVLFSIDGGATFSGTGVFPALPAGIYNVRIKDSLGCVVIYHKNPVEITDPAPFSPLIIVNGNDLTVSTGNGFQWYRNGTQLAGAASQSYTAVQSGDYFAEVTDSSGCVAFTDTVNITATLIESEGRNNGFGIYPNPAGDYIEISLKARLREEVAIGIYDVTGKKIKELTLKENAVPFRINVERLPPGAYFITAATASETWNSRFCKL